MTLIFGFSSPSPRLTPAVLRGPHSHLRLNGSHRFLRGMIGIVLLTLAFPLPAQDTQRQAGSVPDYIAYHRIFHHVALLNQMADTAKQKGQNRSNLRQLVPKRVRLTEAESASLERISLQCEIEVAAQDAAAKVIIDQFHTQYPSKVIYPNLPPKPPPELETLWQERNNIILRARDRLRAELGENDFAKFDQFVKEQGSVPTSYSAVAVHASPQATH